MKVVRAALALCDEQGSGDKPVSRRPVQELIERRKPVSRRPAHEFIERAAQELIAQQYELEARELIQRAEQMEEDADLFRSRASKLRNSQTPKDFCFCCCGLIDFQYEQIIL